jgi:hypothetical protein
LKYTDVSEVLTASIIRVIIILIHLFFITVNLKFFKGLAVTAPECLQASPQ